MSDEETKNGQLWYPRVPGNGDEIHVSLWDVRAADDLIISYDFDRDGWRIGMDRTRYTPGLMVVISENEEVAFIPAWNDEPELMETLDDTGEAQRND